MSGADQKLLEHFRNPKNVGTIENADGYGRGENPVNGYLTDIYIKVENGQIQDIKFKTFGCTVTIASASALTEIVKGKTLEELVEVENPIQSLMNLIEIELGGVPEKNWHCPPTAIQVLFTAISEFYKKQKNEKKRILLEKLLADLKLYIEKRLEEIE